MEKIEGEYMEIYLKLIGRCFILYFFVIIILRIMGKREVGELSVFDLVIYFVMSELLAIVVESDEHSIFEAIVPMITLSFLQIALSICVLKVKWLRDIIEGKPVILIENGKMNQKEMKKQRYSIDDLLFQLRDKNVGSVREVEFAILENSGVLTVLKKGQCTTIYPFALISDGEVIKENLKKIGQNEIWLKEKLLKKGIHSYQEVFLCTLEKGGLFVEMKDTN